MGLGLRKENTMAVKITGVNSNAGNGLITTSYAEDALNKGQEWYAGAVVDLASEGILNFLLDFSEVPANREIRIFARNVSSSEEEIRFRIFRDTDYTGGDAVTVFNRNTITAEQDEKNFVITSGATGTDKGTQYPELVAFASNSFLGGNNPGALSVNILKLDTSVNWLLEIENVGTGTTTVFYEGIIFETSKER